MGAATERGALKKRQGRVWPCAGKWICYASVIRIGSDDFALRLVAVIFLVTGLFGVVEICEAITHARLAFPYEVLGIPVFFGLVQYQNLWRVLGVLMLLVRIVVYPLIIFDLAQGEDAPIQLIGWMVAAWIGNVWMLKVLFRPSLRALFLKNRTRKSLLHF